jgi:HEAT repeat protein
MSLRPGLIMVLAFLFAIQDSAIDQLVRELGSEDIDIREKAQETLIQLGTEALPALEKAIQSEDREVAGRPPEGSSHLAGSH